MQEELTLVKGVGENLSKSFKKLGIWNTYDLVSTLPKKWSNFAIHKYDSLKHLDNVTVIGTVESPIKSVKKKVTYTTTFIRVEQYNIKLNIYGRGYLDKVLNVGDEVVVKGRFNLFLREINVEYITKNTDIPELKPVYHLGKIADTTISNILKEIYQKHHVDIYETLPQGLIEKHHLLSRKNAIYQYHFPESKESLESAMVRFKKEEAFFEQLKYLYHLNPKMMRDSIKYQLSQVKAFIDHLPYQLTFEQQEVVNDIYKDYKKNESMYRLIQGDVGSGKTITAFIAGLGMITAGFQVAFMAPTELLAKQHFDNFKKLFNVDAAIFTSTVKNKDDVKASIKKGETKFVFGTHALSSSSVEFNQLGLVIIDEQHKFGVEVRNDLIKKSLTKDVLYLTATPIPRSLSLTLLGDLDVSSIKIKPNKKSFVETKLMVKQDIEEIVKLLKFNQSKAEQSFVVVPAIIDKQKKDSIENVFLKLSLFFKSEDLFVIHGGVKQEDQDLIMSKFMSNKKAILLSTTLIEVGIDVSNATLMIIFGAENFGLSQLHQLRGRVGRGQKNGICYLLSNKSDVERLKFLESTNDGFLLSEYDLKLRGPGIFSGFIQTGNVELKFLDLTNDEQLILSMKEDAKYFLKHIDKYPYLNRRINDIIVSK